MARLIMNNFCVLPFNSISIAPTGELRPCCNTDGYKYNFSVQNSDIENLINNSDAVSLRSSFLKNEKDPRCDRCWKIESIGSKSFRETANSDLDKGLQTVNFAKVKNKIDYDDIYYLDITLGNKCNLACRMCNASSSSLFAMQLVQLDKHYGPINFDFDRNTRNKILEAIDRSKNLNTIYLLGGEPLVNDFHDEIVDLLIQKKISKNITLHYSTNLQIDVEKYLTLWQNFKLVQLGVSIDGTDETYEYIRWPGKWNKLYNNLKKVIEFRNNDKLNLLYPSVATTVQNLNAHNIPDLIEQINSLDHTLSFYFIPVTGGHYLNMCPTDVLDTAIEKLKKIDDPYGIFAGLINFYNDAKSLPVENKNVEKFFDSQKKFDGLRNQNLFRTIPHFVDYAEGFNIDLW